MILWLSNTSLDTEQNNLKNSSVVQQLSTNYEETNPAQFPSSEPLWKWYLDTEVSITTCLKRFWQLCLNETPLSKLPVEVQLFFQALKAFCVISVDVLLPLKEVLQYSCE